MLCETRTTHIKCVLRRENGSICVIGGYPPVSDKRCNYTFWKVATGVPEKLITRRYLNANETRYEHMGRIIINRALLRPSNGGEKNKQNNLILREHYVDEQMDATFQSVTVYSASILSHGEEDLYCVQTSQFLPHPSRHDRRNIYDRPINILTHLIICRTQDVHLCRSSYIMMITYVLLFLNFIPSKT